MTRMVRRTVTAILCDVCGADDATSYRIGFSERGAPRKFDLCPEHAAPLEEIRAAADGGHVDRDGRRRPVKVAQKPAKKASGTKKPRPVK